MSRKRTKVLDCTLRDGGYCNNWKFGAQNITRLIRSLEEANIDIIECGFVTKNVSYDKDSTKFPNFEKISQVIPETKKKCMYVCMINYGEYDVNEIPNVSDTRVDGIRVAFHKKDMKLAIDYADKLIKKGYKVFLQPMVSLNYTEEEFVELIRCANEIEPFAFYIVDSFGGMKGSDLLRLFYCVENLLNENIAIGFHSHNNMQLAYSNAEMLLTIKTSRSLIIDASIYGMGRGAGNLNTELIVESLNDFEGEKYYLTPILTVIDHVLNRLYQDKSWGYSIPNYLSAKNNVHPNYANYLVEKQTLRIQDMDMIFARMSKEKKAEFDKNYIDNMYFSYMQNGKCYETNLGLLKNVLQGQSVLIIAPGKSSVSEKDKVERFIKSEKPIIISINFEYKYANVDYIFVSNLRRYEELSEKAKRKCILTSNVLDSGEVLKVDYSSLLNDVEAVKDNAGLMLIDLLIKINVKNIRIAGMDGYLYACRQNYSDESLEFITEKGKFDERNEGMRVMLKKYSCCTDIKFITTSQFM